MCLETSPSVRTHPEAEGGVLQGRAGLLESHLGLLLDAVVDGVQHHILLQDRHGPDFVNEGFLLEWAVFQGILQDHPAWLTCRLQRSNPVSGAPERSCSPSPGSGWALESCGLSDCLGSASASGSASAGEWWESSQQGRKCRGQTPLGTGGWDTAGRRDTLQKPAPQQREHVPNASPREQGPEVCHLE